MQQGKKLPTDAMQISNQPLPDGGMEVKIQLGRRAYKQLKKMAEPFHLKNEGRTIMFALGILEAYASKKRKCSCKLLIETKSDVFELVPPKTR